MKDKKPTVGTLNGDAKLPCGNGSTSEGWSGKHEGWDGNEAIPDGDAKFQTSQQSTSEEDWGL